MNASSSDEIDAAFAALVRERPDALLVAPDAFYNSRRVQLATLAARHARPAAYSVRYYAETGGLMSYSTSIGVPVLTKPEDTCKSCMVPESGNGQRAASHVF